MKPPQPGVLGGKYDTFTLPSLSTCAPQVELFYPCVQGHALWIGALLLYQRQQMMEFHEADVSALLRCATSQKWQDMFCHSAPQQKQQQQQQQQHFLRPMM